MNKPSPKKIDVAILGTSPAGLVLAIHLLRAGIYPHLIDDGYEDFLTENDPHQLVFLNIRSLEMFRQLGLSDAIAQQGREITGVHFYNARTDAFEPESYLGMIAGAQTEIATSIFSSPIVLSLKNLRRILVDYLTQQACKILWETRCVSYFQHEAGVDLDMETASGHESWKSRFLVVSHDHKNLEWKTQKWPNTWTWADVGFLNENFARGSAFHLEIQHPAVLGLLAGPEKGKGRVFWRPELSQMPPSPNWKIEHTHTFSGSFKLGATVLDRNILRIGEGQIQAPPVAGFLCNHGLQDAWNLGWKLARVLKDPVAKGLLNSFLQERSPVTERLFNRYLDTFNQFSDKGWIVRKLAAFRIRRHLKKLGIAAAFVNRQWAFWNHQTLHHRSSGLSVHHSRTERCKAGDQVPYFVIFDEKQKIQTDTHAWFSKSVFMIWIIGSISQHNLHAITQWTKQKYPRELALFYLPYSKRNQRIFDYFQMKEEDSQVLIIRPDLHIAYMCNHIHVGLIDNYLKTVIGFVQVK